MGSMYMSETLLTQDLMSTAYKKFWPVTNGKRRGEEPVKYRCSRQRSRSCGAAFRTQGMAQEIMKRSARKVEFNDSNVIVVETMVRNDRATNGNDTIKTNGDYAVNMHNNQEEMRQKWKNDTGKNGFSRLDMSTLQNIGWVSGANDEKKHEALVKAEDFYSMTKVEFRRLQEQVKDVSMNLRNKFRTSAYQKLYQRPNPENPNQIYRSQLAASLKAFQQKQWPPLSHQELETTYIRCKPVQANYERPSTSCSMRGGPPSRPLRPKSVPASSLRQKLSTRSDTPTDVRPGKFDTLRPSIASEFIGPTERPPSDYEGPADEKAPFVDELIAETKRFIENDDTSTTSGIDSGASDNESPSSDEDSDFEPEIDEEIVIPELNLRPEKLDAIYKPEPKRGWRQYDFDMSNIDIPPYEFESPLPEDLEDLDLRQMAKLKWNWRNHVKNKTSRDSDLEGVLDRLVEFEKLQADTIEWENKRAAQIKKALPRRNNSSKSLQSLIKDKRCDTDCLQATCFGDCPEKLVTRPTCEYCRQAFCTGTCKELKYDQRMRQSRMEEERPVTPKPPFPRACVSCQKRHNAKFINANNLILGTQRLNNSTFNRGQGSQKPKDIRPKTPNSLSKDVLKEFEKLNIEASLPPRPNTTMAINRPRSRNSSFPGKSFNSQRKNSLTELDKVGTVKKKRTKSAVKVKRPKTAG
ncbi:uncharacterized protein LOC123548981 isoform X2 [Mercenaria mercenaria]|uniref:uncharacterized protein LOC123548981 isoform X2 n=1 Tax=Mercenaria mercenaria TaxID=6596 RepID=UPI00234F8B33|nr:uncharacterized protein LOC123548981 isoform X2 [Mercenaria mercenaria]